MTGHSLTHQHSSGSHSTQKLLSTNNNQTVDQMSKVSNDTHSDVQAITAPTAVTFPTTSFLHKVRTMMCYACNYLSM